MFTATIGRVRGSGIAGRLKTLCILLVLLSSHIAQAGPVPVQSAVPDSIERSIQQLEQVLPKTAAEFDAVTMEQLLRALTAVDLASAELGSTTGLDVPQNLLNRITRLSVVKEAVDKSLDGI